MVRTTMSLPMTSACLAERTDKAAEAKRFSRREIIREKKREDAGLCRFKSHQRNFSQYPEGGGYSSRGCSAIETMRVSTAGITCRRGRKLWSCTLALHLLQPDQSISFRRERSSEDMRL